MAKPKRSVEQIVDAPSVYPGDVSRFYRETPDSLMGDLDVLQNNVETLIRAGLEMGLSAQEVADNLGALFMSETSKAKVKTDG